MVIQLACAFAVERREREKKKKKKRREEICK
jgi:hypothetical protein